MRSIFINTLTELAEKDQNIYLLTGDLGFSFFEEFSRKFSKRFINCGVAEQNMMGLAAGLALNGKKPYVYSIIPFVTMRCLEQIRNDVCYQNLDVKIVGAGVGFSYGHLGATHHAIEDLGILRSLPNLTILCPADPVETKELVLKTYQNKNPTYLRLSGDGKKILYNFNPEILIGKPSVLKEGDEGVILTTGIFLEIGGEIVDKLKKAGHNFKLISMHTIKPIDGEALFKELKGKKLIFTLEEHNLIGGLGSAVAEILMESGFKGLFKRLAIADEYCQEVGSRNYLCKKYGLDSDIITNYILRECKNLI